jgi:hypothetical protein
MIGIPLDIERPDEEILADIDRIYEGTKHVKMGERPDAQTAAFMRQAYQDAIKTPVSA